MSLEHDRRKYWMYWYDPEDLTANILKAHYPMEIEILWFLESLDGAFPPFLSALLLSVPDVPCAFSISISRPI